MTQIQNQDSDKENLFIKEEEILDKALGIIKSRSIDGENSILSEFQTLAYDYKKLLRQVKKLVNITDQQQRVMTKMNETELEKKNQELLKAVKELKIEKKQLSIAEKMQNKLLKNLEKINSALEKFVPKDFLKYLGKESITEIEYGDQIQQEMTILFSDIRSFTTLSESMTPQETFNFINSFLNVIAPAVRGYNGFIDKYIGDAIMALFPHSPSDAINASVKMIQRLQDYNKERIEKGVQPIEIGIGIHTGLLMLGIIGEEERMSSTVISDSVNLASRIEGLTKMYGAQIIISESSLEKLSDKLLFKRNKDYNSEDEIKAIENMDIELNGKISDSNQDGPPNYYFRFLDKVRVKGKKESIDIYEILYNQGNEIVELKIKYKKQYQVAVFDYMSRRFELAYRKFKKLYEINPHDKAVALFIKRCEGIRRFDSSGKLIGYKIPKNWDGATQLDTK